MLSFSEVLAKMLAEDAETLQQFIAKKIIKESQVGAILHKSSGIDKNSDGHSFQVAIDKLITVLNLIHAMDLLNTDSKGHENTIKRLLSKNGNETINEFLSHLILKTVFGNYLIMLPLYGQSADGQVSYKEGGIPVEIKSRFPEKCELLEDFYKQAFELPGNKKNTDNFDAVYTITLTDIKGLTKEAIAQELIFLKGLIDGFDYKTMPQVTHGTVIARQMNGVAYLLTVFLRPKPPEIRRFIGIDNYTMDRISEVKPIHYSVSARAGGDEGMGTSCEAIGLIADNVKEDLAHILITQCFRTAKNLPDEPRIIFIYTTRGREFVAFIETIVTNYLERHPGTMIIVANMHFQKDIGASFEIRCAKHGAKLNEFIQAEYAVPEPRK